MWIRVGTFSVKPGEVDRLTKTYNELAVPKVRGCHGNVACLLLVPTVDGEPFMAVTIWETRADAESYESSGSAIEVVSLVRDCFAGPPKLVSYQSDSTSGIGRVAG
jgi:heme-degrading monooxygenase HmoA